MKTTTLICLSILGIATNAPAAGPNIILVMPDDAGYGDYSGLGNPIIKTPSVDAFMKQSLLLTQFHASPTCSPCRAALMSGRHEFRCGVTHTIGGRERMSLEMVTLAQTLRSAGYTTGIFGKWHLGDEAAYRPENRGFDEVFIHGSGGIGQAGDAPGNHNINPTLWHNDHFEETEGYCTDLYFDRATEWIDEKRKADQPLFAFIATNAPHAPHDLYEKDYQQYLGIPRIREEVAKFYGMVENIDANFGKLLGRLDQWQMTEETLVIYLGSDNGGTAGRNIFNAGMKGGKATPYQGGTRVPCMIRWPAGKVPAGAECNALTSVVDLYPTLVRIAGATLSDDAQTQIEGWDLSPLLENPNADWPDRYLVHHVGRWDRGQSQEAKFTNFAIQDSRFTLVNNSELYDLENDPGESTNVMDDHPQVVALLRAEYDRWWAETLPMMVNESAAKPNGQPFRELYRKQFGRIPDKGTETNKRPRQDDAEGLAERERLRKLRAERRQRSKDGKDEAETTDSLETNRK